MATIKIKRGTIGTIPTGSAGEPLFGTDQFRLYVGDGSSNRLMAVLNKIDATSAPGSGDDAGDGYSEGSTWVDVTNNKSYTCVDAAVGSAIWQQTSGVGVGGVTSVNGYTGTVVLDASDVSADPAGTSASLAASLGALAYLGTVGSSELTNDSVTDGKLRNSAALSVIGRSTNSTGDPADIAAANDGEVLRRAGANLGFGKLASGAFDDNTIAPSRTAFAVTKRVNGRKTAAAGAGEEVSASELLDWVGNTRGAVLYKGVSGWDVLVPNAVGKVLTDGGVGADPSWSDPTLSIQTATNGDLTLLDYIPGYSLSATANRRTNVSQLFGLFRLQPGGRLTGAFASAVPNADVVSCSTIYYTPATEQGGSNSVTLWDGAKWIMLAFAQFAISLGTLSNATPYDMFLFTSEAVPSATNTTTDIITFASGQGWATGSMVTVDVTGGGLTAGTTYYWNAASSTTGSFHTTTNDAFAATSKVDLTASITANVRGISMEIGAAWTGDTLRSAAVSMQDGFWCLNSDKKRLLIGSFYTTGTTTTEDSNEKRYLSNFYNKTARRFLVRIGTNNNGVGTSFTHTGVTWSGVNADSGNKAMWMACMETSVARVRGFANVLNASGACFIGMGISSSTSTLVGATDTATDSRVHALSCEIGHSAIGRYSFNMCARVGAGTATFQADRAPNGGSFDTVETYLEGFVLN